MPSRVQPSNCHKVQTSPLSSLPQAKFTLSYSKVFTKMNGKKKSNTFQTHFIQEKEGNWKQTAYRFTSVPIASSSQG